MNILICGQYNKANIDFASMFNQEEHIVFKAFWSEDCSEKDTFIGNPLIVDFKKNVSDVLFHLSFEPDSIFILCENLMESWAISSIKRHGYISSNIFVIVRDFNFVCTPVEMAILESIDACYILNKDDVTFNTNKYILLNLFNLDISDELKTCLKKIINIKLIDESFLSKIIKEIDIQEKNINCNEVIL